MTAPASDPARLRFFAVLSAILAVVAATTWHADFLGTDDWFFIDFGRRPLSWDRLFTLQREGTPAIRPLALVMARLEWLVLGEDALPRRLLYLVLHGVCALLVRATARALGPPGRADLTALLFAAWPLHGEPLAWYHSAETAMEFTVLAFGACAAWVSGRHRLATGLVLTALLVRENAVAVAPVLVVLDLGRGVPWRSALRRAAAPLVLTVAYVALRVLQIAAAVGSQHGATLPLTNDPVGTALQLLFHLTVPVQPAVPGAWLWLTVCAAAALGALVTLAIFARRSGENRRSVVGALLILAVLAAPFVPLYDAGDPVFTVHPSVYERRWYHLYPLAAALGWLVALALDRAPKWLRGISVLFALSLLVANAQFWAGFGPSLRAATETARSLGQRPVGLVIDPAPTDPIEAELIEHRILDLQRVLGRPALVYKQDPDGAIVISQADSLGYPRWVAPTSPKGHVRIIPDARTIWVAWDSSTNRLSRVTPRVAP